MMEGLMEGPANVQCYTIVICTGILSTSEEDDGWHDPNLPAPQPDFLIESEIVRTMLGFNVEGSR